MGDALEAYVEAQAGLGAEIAINSFRLAPIYSRSLLSADNFELGQAHQMRQCSGNLPLAFMGISMLRCETVDLIGAISRLRRRVVIMVGNYVCKEARLPH